MPQKAKKSVKKCVRKSVKPAKASKRTRGKRKACLAEQLPQINLHAAGIDLGASDHWVCVPPGSVPSNVRSFPTHTPGLERLADWLIECRVTTVAMEATGVYWIPVFQVLETRGLEVKLVNARQIKNVDGRKTDILDCQWIQQLHTFGLLRGSFRPQDEICVLRSYMRQREDLVQGRSAQVLLMQKALDQMNVLLHRAVSDITGLSGLSIVQAILAGERDPQKLASLVHWRVRKTTAQIAQYLQGDFRPEHLFVLQQALELYQVFSEKIRACEERMTQYLASLETKAGAAPPLPASTKTRSASSQNEQEKQLRRGELYRLLGVDLTAIEGIGPLHAQVILSEIGRNVAAWRSEKQFTSWLGLCPDNRITGGRVISVRNKRVKNRVATALRMAASSLERKRSGLGAYYRRMKGKLGPAAGLKATAHKLARLVYRMLKYGETYVAVGQAEYEARVWAKQLKSLRKKAAHLGYELVSKTPNSKGPNATERTTCIHVS